MANNIGELSVKLSADARNFYTQMGNARKEVKKTESSFSKLATIAKRIGPALIGTATVGTIAKLTKSATDLAGVILDNSRAIGISTDAYQQWEQVLRKVDSSQEAFNVGLLTLNERIGQAQQGLTSAQRGFDRFGVSIVDANGDLRDTESVLADVLQGARNATQSDVAAGFRELFAGSSFELQKLLTLTNEEVEAIKEVANVQSKEVLESTDRVAKKYNELVTTIGNDLVKAWQKVIVTVLSGGDTATPTTKLKEELAEIEATLSKGTIERGFLNLTTKIRRSEQIDFENRRKEIQTILDERQKAADTEAAQEEKRKRDAENQANRVKALEQEKIKAKEEAVEATKLEALAEKEFEAAVKASEAAVKADNAEYQSWIQNKREAARVLIESIDPQEKYNNTLSEYIELRKLGLLTDRQFAEAASAAAGSLNETTQEAVDTNTALNDTARELGFTFTSAFEEAVIGANKFRDVLQGLGQDIAKILLRKAITEPLANAIGSIDFGSFFGGSKQVGGPIDQGKVYKVHKDEYIIPRVPGTVVPVGQGRASPNVSVEIINQGQPVDAQVGASRTTPEGVIIPIVLKNLRKPNSSLRTAIRGIA